ncbi:short-chain dehydrogenase [Salinibacter sp. 10B]|uniref:SDR family oxidoreductase n=1 Tax=Salinibacter sp. 10B TaxID=1923971 RepID=UPI000CF47B5F|nr:SDR family oxidoreductase [Salinibacter sp. 10B]PQJ36028.1 short-chain dehydrogenase [Salinibacter sp. 10B]
MNLRNRLVWITGASSGIGEALAYECSQRGAQLVLSSRREETLHEVRTQCPRPEEHRVQTLDLADPASLQQAAETVQHDVGPVDVLINNGGISQRSTAAEAEMDVVRRIMEVNFFGTVQLTKAVLPTMQKREAGQIAVVSSIVGKFGTPKRSSYAASKHALHGWFDSLRAEVHDEGIGVTMICPGFVKTNVATNALSADGTPQGEAGRDKGMPAPKCAETIADAIERGKDEVYIGGWEITGVYAKRFVPSLFRRMIRRYDGT